ncbi:3-dehydroquinate synthase [Paenibacillus macquariensis]|uniref:3-dehydroquinate synthase n=1 Tax=Paenibacillus macquariensis TaxID=948756 RepID=UPI002DBDBA8C|nr:3-dehydroquinate synthase [Paenibacillus macquariensis]MEC0090187.1 3-dehydroquinate synthase [Paenibacillus macquariensis]
MPLKKYVDSSYDIEVGSNLYGKLSRDLKDGIIENVNRYAIITDSNVKDLFGEHLLNLLRNDGFYVEMFTFPSGEQNKTRETKAQLEDQMLAKSYGRDSCIIALGGGTVSDLSGYLAGTYCRGIPYINYPTTLLAAADASIGGKTAVNTPVATNLIGVFHQPRKVYIDLITWGTLPYRQIRSGLAETIIHACLGDINFFQYLENNIARLYSPNNELSLDNEVCEHIAFKNCEIKFRVVEKDDEEKNFRKVLNLGHTAGRAIEALSNYNLLHGEAVAIGLAFQAYLGKKLNFNTIDEYRRIINLLKLAELPTEIPNDIKSVDLINKMYTDKKVRNSQIHFVFQDGIGKMKQFNSGDYSIPISEELLLESLDEFRKL